MDCYKLNKYDLWRGSFNNFENHSDQLMNFELWDCGISSKCLKSSGLQKKCPLSLFHFGDVMLKFPIKCHLWGVQL